MSGKLAIFILSPILLFISCKDATKKQVSAPAKKDTVDSASHDKLRERTVKRKLFGVADSTDSIMLDKILQDALHTAYLNSGKRTFKKQFELMMPDSSFNVSVEINNDFHFTKDFPHLIIRRNTPGLVYINIFFWQEHRFKPVLEHEQASLEFVNDTIRDINGDGVNDFVVNWYGTTGCCLKGFSNVYLSRPDMQSFSKNFEFINPTFSPTEGVIRGVAYGQPGETSMYKYKWNGEAIDTIEYVYYERDKKTGKIIIEDGPSHVTVKHSRKLNAAPTEYRKIYGYDWFTGK